MYKKIYISFFDPLLYWLIYSIFSISVLIFIYTENSIEKEFLFWNAIITEICYIIGILSFNNKILLNRKENINSLNYTDKHIKNILYVLYVIMYFGIKLLFFIIYGIPIIDFNNHIDALLVNGFITKFETAISPILYFLVIDRFINKKSKDIVIIILGIIIVELLSGSKAALVNIIFAIFFYQLYVYKFSLGYVKLKSLYIFFGVLSMIGVFVPFVFGSISSETVTISELLGRFALRLVSSGDIFAYFYNSNISDYIMSRNSFWNMFITYYGAAFKLSSYEEINGTIGYQIVSTIYNTMEATAAPNTRHNIWGLVSFGIYGAPIFSFMIGVITSFVTRFLYVKLRGLNIYTFLLYTIIYFGVTSFSVDFIYGMDYIIYGIMFNSILMLIVYNVIKILKY